MKVSRRNFTNTLISAGATLPFGLPGNLLASNSSAAVKAPVSLNLFSKGMEWLDYDAFTDTVLAAGYTGIDLTVREGGHVLPENVERDLPKLVDFAHQKKLTVPLIVTSIISADNPMSERVLKTASQLGIRHYRMGYYRYDPKRNLSQYLNECLTKLQGLAMLNQKYAIQAGTQNHHGAYIGAPVLDIWQLIQNIDQKLVSIQYDTAHAQVENVFSWPQTMRMVKDRIGSLALKDYQWELVDKKIRVNPVPIGEGSVNFNDYFKLLRAENIQAPFTLHVEYPLLTDTDKHLSISQKIKKIIPVLQQDANKIRELWANA